MKKFPIRSVLLFFALIPMLFCASEVTDGARKGLLLWYNSVVPALFPFMVLSGLIVSGGGIAQIMSPFYWLLHPILGFSKDGCYVLVSGLLCGYPMGAKTCAEFVRDERISLAEGNFLMAICNHPSPMFLLGYVYPWFADHVKISELLLCVYAPVLVLAAAAKIIYRFHDRTEQYEENTHSYETERILEAERIHESEGTQNASTADETILSSVEVLCKIGGYLVLFSILIIIIQNTAMIPDIVKLILIGIMEMTTGIREFAALENWKVGYIASIAALTFGGLSGIFQTQSVLHLPPLTQQAEFGEEHISPAFSNKKKAGLSIRPYFFWKLIHAILSAGLSYIICTII